MKKYTMLLSVLISLLTSEVMFSQTFPHQINYQGVLKDASGVVVANGDYILTFNLYNTNSGGTALWTEMKSLNVTDGIINTQLGSVTPIDLPFDNEYYLGIKVGTENELTPRVKLSSVPYSYMSMYVPDGSITMSKIPNDQVVKSLNSLKDNVNLLAGSNITITPSGNNLTISTTGSSGLTLPFVGELSTQSTTAIEILHSATTGSNYSFVGRINSSLGAAIKGIAPNKGVIGITEATTGIAYGVQGESNSTSGHGIHGAAISNTGTTYGVYGISYSTIGTGVYGYANDNSGPENYGVHGRSESPVGQGIRGISPYIGTYGRSELTSGTSYGAFGRSLSTGGYGVYGTSPNIGVYGISSSTSGIYDGVYGKSNSPTGHGVYGTAPTVGMQGTATGTSGENYGVIGLSNSSGGTGVWGDGPYNGVVGIATGPAGTSAGVRGYASSVGDAAFAGIFHGHLYVYGEIYQSGATFKIDHPLDPENKYLNYSSVESPDRKNIYDGTATLDDYGEATIVLPEWFESLNKDFRYQITAIGTPGPNLYVAQKISNNRFKIAGGSQGMEISWQVTGIRKDAYALKYPQPLEEYKNDEDRGKYLHPEAFGQLREEGIGALQMPMLQIDTMKDDENPSLPDSTDLDRQGTPESDQD